jgi:hypothetical protein
MDGRLFRLFILFLHKSEIDMTNGMPWIYRTDYYGIAKQSDSWTILFGVDIYLVYWVQFGICNLIWEAKSLKECFEYLVKWDIISKEEMHNQEYLWKPLTN